jgi:hypothetical protein
MDRRVSDVLRRSACRDRELVYDRSLLVGDTDVVFPVAEVDAKIRFRWPACAFGGVGAFGG